MGHLRHLKREYRELVDRLEAGTAALPEPQEQAAWEAWREVLEILYTPEEAALAAKLPVLPSSLAAVARQTGVAEAELRPRLDALCDRGLVMDLVSPTTGETSYFLSPPVVGFFEFSFMRAGDLIPKKRLAEALEAYTRGDDGFYREVFAHETVIGRALAHETAIDEEDLPEVLEWERATAVIENARSIAVSLCMCRHKNEHLGRACDAPMENCLSLEGGADFVIRRKFGRAIERSEAMDILHAARERGLVQIADNVRNRPAYLCNCCGCCCEQLQGIQLHGLAAVVPSGFLAEPEADLCAGCSRCARACPIGAITMEAHRNQPGPRASMLPAVQGDRCIGCGVCVGACHKHAMRLKRVANPPHVPANTVEKAVRMAIEHGRLAHLVADEGAGRGHRFLNRILAALLALPPARQAMANEQLKSRFIEFVLKQVRDPTA